MLQNPVSPLRPNKLTILFCVYGEMFARGLRKKQNEGTRLNHSTKRSLFTRHTIPGREFNEKSVFVFTVIHFVNTLVAPQTIALFEEKKNTSASIIREPSPKLRCTIIIHVYKMCKVKKGV